ncbi:hypothetical protein PCANC_09505 [Puccinia coronata f. sp. avenae]|uniref:Uncharacterized protein n=1 Tax=Puccinia coronata f. sp. avenae TaxID=200324 RepID=A0A2N5T652_9BASI|nr:hypothetical protein PCANC_11273 [Puccinia coronata f. sp. avenae]PLW54026.1 hypothetical protein PCANC_09505 [Puccinia coronata f. sp. avenae]
MEPISQEGILHTAAPTELNKQPEMEVPPEHLGDLDHQTSPVSEACDTSGNLGHTLGNEKENHLDDDDDDDDDDASRPIRDKTGKPFEVYDWSFLREDPENKKTAQNQRKFLRYLNKCQRKKDKKYGFSISRDQAAPFLTDFSRRYKKLHEFSFDVEAVEQVRNSHFYDILLGISNRRIDLGRYQTFSREIVGKLIRRVRKHLQAANISFIVLSKRVKLIKKFIADVTKISHILIVIVLSLYKEHEQDVLTERQVQEILDFLRDLWFRLERQSAFEGENWAMRVHKTLKADGRFGLKLAGKKEARYRLCRNFVNCWIKHKNMDVKTEDGKMVHEGTFIHLIHKILYFSN